MSSPHVAEVIPWAEAHEPLRDWWLTKARKIISASFPSQPVYDEEKIARLLALVDDYDGCFERIDEWEALPDWEKRAHPDEEPMSDREDAEWWLRRARALVAALRGGELTREETNG